jgi:hypothetical protein
MFFSKFNTRSPFLWQYISFQYKLFFSFFFFQGATIVDLPVTVTLDPDYQLPPAALAALVVRMLC